MFCPAVPIIRPLSKHFFAISFAFKGSSKSTPIIKPLPFGFNPVAFKASCKYIPFSKTSVKNPSLVISSKTTFEATIAKKFPPKVEPWVPGVKEFAIFSFAITAPTGTPPPNPFADVIMSGSKS